MIDGSGPAQKEEEQLQPTMAAVQEKLIILLREIYRATRNSTRCSICAVVGANCRIVLHQLCPDVEEYQHDDDVKDS